MNCCFKFRASVIASTQMSCFILAATENMKSAGGYIGSMKKRTSFPLRVFSVSLTV